MVSRIANSLPQFGSDLRERIALIEEELKCLTLILREVGEPVLQCFFTVDSFRNRSLVGSGNSGTQIPEILARSGAAGKTSSNFR